MTENSKTTLLLILSGLLIVMGLILFWMWGFTTANQRAVEKFHRYRHKKNWKLKQLLQAFLLRPTLPMLSGLMASIKPLIL